MKKLLILLLVINLAACSPYKRFQRIVKNHPEVLDSFVKVKYITKVDTIVETDTFIQKEYKDSFVLSHDTTIITERIIITKKGPKIYVTLPADTIHVKDTVLAFPRVPVITYEEPKRALSDIIDILPIMLFVLGFSALIMFLRNSK
jgi:hypothetical protein